MYPRAPVYRRDHGNFDIQIIHQQIFRVVVDVVPGRRLDAILCRRAVMRNLDATAAAGVRLGAERVAGASENHAAVFVVARDIHERVGQLLMGAGGPFHLGIVGMARHLEDAVAALHLDVFVLVAVVLEFDHRHRRCPSVSIRIRSASRNRCRECTKPRAETANRSTLRRPLPSSRDRTTLAALPMEGRSNDEYGKARAHYRRWWWGRLDQERL